MLPHPPLFCPEGVKRVFSHGSACNKYEYVFSEGWTVDNLLGRHNSRPYNLLIANTLFRGRGHRSMGTGNTENQGEL